MRRRGRHRGGFRGVAPTYTLMGESARPADRRCRRRSGESTRCEPPKKGGLYCLYAVVCTANIPMSCNGVGQLRWANRGVWHAGIGHGGSHDELSPVR